MRFVKQPMSSDRAKALRDECLRDMEQTRGTADYQSHMKRLLKLNEIIVRAETREADERAASKPI